MGVCRDTFPKPTFLDANLGPRWLSLNVCKPVYRIREIRSQKFRHSVIKEVSQQDSLLTLLHSLKEI